MSIIGTRPPLLSETSLYELHHRAKMKRQINLMLCDTKEPDRFYCAVSLINS